MTPFGDRAVRFRIESGAPRRKLFAALSRLPGVLDVVLTEEVGCVVFDLGAARPATDEAVARTLGSIDPSAEAATTANAHVLRVVYDGEDLTAVAEAIGRRREAVIELHAEREYHVAMLGFLPGFGYLRGLAPELQLPRRAPRPRVPANSVAIAAQYTGIYPFGSPGGWHLLGRAIDFEPFGAIGGHATLAIGDRVRFSPAIDEIARADTAKSAAPAKTPTAPYLEIVRAAGIAIPMDGGRRGRMHEGVPPGGPLVPSMLARANALVGNEPSACGIELSGTLEVVARGGSIHLADESAASELAEGERHLFSTRGRARATYLAIAGGLDARVILGGRGALLAAGIGRPLVKGDRLEPSSTGGRAPAPSDAPADDDRPIALLPGPDLVAGFDLAQMTSRPLRISPASDRTGTRLEGWTPSLPPRGPDASRSSAPMVAGAVELTPSGLIVLGPDHPTTGGYPVVALVRSTSLGALFRRPLGASVDFVLEG